MAEAGPMLDHGASYSAIGYSDLCTISASISMNWSDHLASIPPVFTQCPYWQYSTGEHQSKARFILGSVVLSAYADDGTKILISHLDPQGSSQ